MNESNKWCWFVWWLFTVPAFSAPSLHRPLCDAGMPDVAANYLAWIAEKPFCDDELQSRFSLAIAEVHFAALTSQRCWLPRDEHWRELDAAATRAVSDHPNDPEAVLLTAHAAYHGDSLENAELFATRAAQLANDVAKSRRALGTRDADLEPIFRVILLGKLLAIQAARHRGLAFAAELPERTETLLHAHALARDAAQRYASYQAGMETKLLAATILNDLGDTDAARATLDELQPLAWSDFPTVRTEALRALLELNLRERRYEETRRLLVDWEEKTTESQRQTAAAERCRELAAETLTAEAAEHPATADTLLAEAQRFRPIIPPNSIAASIALAVTAQAGNTDTTVSLDQAAAQQRINSALAQLARAEVAPQDAAPQNTTLQDATNAFESALTLPTDSVTWDAVIRWRRQLATLYAVTNRPLDAAIVMASCDDGTPNTAAILGQSLTWYETAWSQYRDAGEELLATTVAACAERLAAELAARVPQPPLADHATRIRLLAVLQREPLDVVIFDNTALFQDAAVRCRVACEIGVRSWNRYTALFSKSTEAAVWLDLAEKSLRIALEENNSSDTAMRDLACRVLAQVLLTRGHNEEALTILDGVMPDDNSEQLLVASLRQEATRRLSPELPPSEVELLCRDGRFEEALQLIEAMLREHPARLPLHRDAAIVLTAWSEKTKDATLAWRAVRGNDTLWGWDGIIARTANTDGDLLARDAYFEAMYERWRLLLAQAELQLELKQQCQREWRRFQLLRPDLGGTAWQAKFRSLFGQ